jgi:hypothetical protein
MQHATLVLGDPLVMRPCRPADRLLAHVLGASLDRDLASGQEPEASWLLAARAQDIVSLGRRRALARDWDHLLAVASRPHGGRYPARPVRAERVTAAEPAIRELTRRLRAPSPVAARGVAMASVLLTDATGPVYNQSSRVTLAVAIEAAIDQLDPALPLIPEPRSFNTGW